MLNTEAPPPLHISRVFNAPADIVFDAWVRPDLMRKWLFVGPDSSIVSIEADLVRYGKFSILEIEKQHARYIDHYGRYYEIEKPLRLEFSLSVPAHFSGETMVIIDIVEKGSQCELHLTQMGIPPEVTRASWQQMLDQLSLTIENQ